MCWYLYVWILSHICVHWFTHVYTLLSLDRHNLIYTQHLFTHVYTLLHMRTHTYKRQHYSRDSSMYTCVHTVIFLIHICVHWFTHVYTLLHMRTHTYKKQHYSCVNTAISFIHTCAHTAISFIHTCVHTAISISLMDCVIYSHMCTLIHTCVHTCVHTATTTSS